MRSRMKNEESGCKRSEGGRSKKKKRKSRERNRTGGEERGRGVGEGYMKVTESKKVIKEVSRNWTVREGMEGMILSGM